MNADVSYLMKKSRQTKKQNETKVRIRASTEVLRTSSNEVNAFQRGALNRGFNASTAGRYKR